MEPRPHAAPGDSSQTTDTTGVAHFSWFCFRFSIRDETPGLTVTEACAFTRRHASSPSYFRNKGPERRTTAYLDTVLKTAGTSRLFRPQRAVPPKHIVGMRSRRTIPLLAFASLLELRDNSCPFLRAIL